MEFVARALGMAIAFLAIATAPPASAEGVRACMSVAQARDVLIDKRFIAPFRALGEGARNGQGEGVGLQLCRLGEQFVYDVTVLRHDGRVVHVLVDAHSGSATIPVRNGK